MILNRFQTWVRTAPASGRASGASALARAYLFSDLDETLRRDAVRVLTELLDDPSPLVRRALAEAFSDAANAPHHIVIALADDQAEIAAIVLARSPLLKDAELIDCAATAGPIAQAAIAGRVALSGTVAAALAEIGEPSTAVALAANQAADLPTFSLRRMVERHGESADFREALLGRADLPPCVRLDLVAATTRALAAFVTERNWMSGERMKRVATEAKDKAAITIVGGQRDCALELVAHLRQSGQLSVGLAFRAILSGRLELFRAVLAHLSGVSLSRVDALVSQCDSTGFAALYRKAGLPHDLIPAFRAALHAARDAKWSLGANLSRAAIERVLTACESVNSGELDKLMALLRRLEAEAARDEARVEADRLKSRFAKRLGPDISVEPLVLTDFDDDSDDLPDSRGFERRGVRREPLPLAIDMSAIEAQLAA